MATTLKWRVCPRAGGEGLSVMDTRKFQPLHDWFYKRHNVVLWWWGDGREIFWEMMGY